MLATYYQLLIDRIKNNVPEITIVELFTNQYNHTEEERPIITPAVYIEFSNITWRDTGINTQEGLLTINIHFVVPHLLPANSDDLNIYNIQVLELLQKIHTSLQGFQMIDNNKYAHSTKLTRISTQYDANSDGLQIWINTYQCTIIDNSSNANNNSQLFNIQNVIIYGNL